MTTEDNELMKITRNLPRLGAMFDAIYSLGWWGLYFPTIEQAEFFLALSLATSSRDRDQIDRIMRGWFGFDKSRWSTNLNGSMIVIAAVQTAETMLWCVTPNERLEP
jgi:hypothetical protein